MSNKESKSDDLSIIRQAKERINDASAYWQDNWDRAKKDLDFLDGNQWGKAEAEERKDKQRVCITNNVLPTFVDQVTGDQRQNRGSIKVLQTGMQSITTHEGKPLELKIDSASGKTSYTLADALNGIIRQIEYNSDAETCYDEAGEAAASSGISYLRLLTKYRDKSFDQDILIKHIDNQFSVIIDHMAKEPDFSDMAWAVIDSLMPKEEFQRTYPTASTNTDGLIDAARWITDKSVRVCEYFTRESYLEEIHLLSDGSIVSSDDYKKNKSGFEERQVSILRTRKSECYKVYWRKITALEVLEGPTEIPCSHIPITPVWGKKLTIGDKRIYRSVIRHALDAQAMANYWDSAATEAVALNPKSPFIAAAPQIENYENQWNQANNEATSVLVYNPMHEQDLGPRRQQPANIPAAEITLGMNSVEKIKSTIGMFDASIGSAGNETSGKAIIARQRQGDRGSFAFIDNLARARKRIGKNIIEMLLRTWDTERTEKLRFEDGSEDFIVLNKSIRSESGDWVTINDLSVASYDVVVTTGPSYLTQRAESADTLIKFAQTIPNSSQAIGDLIAKSLDVYGADDMAKRLRKMIPPELLSAAELNEIKKEREQNEMAEEPKEPPPEVIIKQIELQMKQIELEADQVRLEAEKAKAAAAMQQAQAGSEDAMRAMIADAMAELIPSLIASLSASQPAQALKE